MQLESSGHCWGHTPAAPSHSGLGGCRALCRPTRAPAGQPPLGDTRLSGTAWGATMGASTDLADPAVGPRPCLTSPAGPSLLDV